MLLDWPYADDILQQRMPLLRTLCEGNDADLVETETVVYYVVKPF